MLGAIVDEAFNGPSQATVKVGESVDDVMDSHQNGSCTDCDVREERRGDSIDDDIVRFPFRIKFFFMCCI